MRDGTRDIVLGATKTSLWMEPVVGGGLGLDVPASAFMGRLSAPPAGSLLHRRHVV